MALKMRPTGLGAGINQDPQDFTAEPYCIAVFVARRLEVKRVLRPGTRGPRPFYDRIAS